MLREINTSLWPPSAGGSQSRPRRAPATGTLRPGGAASEIWQLRVFLAVGVYLMALGDT